MRILLSLLLTTFFLGSIAVKAQSISPDKVRDQFFAMDRSEGAAFQLYKSLEKMDLSKDPLMLAYRGAASAASAGTVSGVRKKLEYFNNGKSEIEKAVALRPLDAEIRFLRLATQLKAPGFLGYNDEIKNDKTIVIQTLTNVSPNSPNSYLYLRMCRFIMYNGDLDKAERNTVNQLISKFNPKK